MAKRRSRVLEVVHSETYEKITEYHTNNPKDYHPHHLKSFQAKTDKQKQFFKQYFSHQTPIILQIGSAGTGKTALAMYCALSEVFDPHTPYEKVVIIRSAVQAREIGFLKGTEEEKNEAYEAPYAALCDELLIFKSNNYRNLKEKGMIVFENTSFLRGQTFNNSIIILDELQSCNYHELSTVISRVGTDTKLIMNGDLKQNDLHKRGDVSGLPQFINVLNKMDPNMTAIIEYTPEDIVRSGIVKEFLLAEER